MPFTFPLKDGTLWTRRTLADLQDAYQRVNVEIELQKAARWLQANPTRRKTAAGMERFLTAWLNKADAALPRDQPFSAQELQDARRALTARGGCPHAPRCPSRAFCEGVLIRTWRRDRRKGAKLL